MNYSDTLTSTTSTTSFADTNLTNVFNSNGILNGYALIMDSGANTLIGAISSVSNPSLNGTTWLYQFTTTPSGFSNFLVGDQATFTSLQNSANNGSFIITSIAPTQTETVNFTITTTATLTSGTDTITVASATGIAIGQSVVSPSGIPVGTTVIGISGTTITLSQNSTQNLSGESVTFSYSENVTITGSSNLLTNVTVTSTLATGLTAIGANIPSGTIISSIGVNTVTLSNPVVASIEVSNISGVAESGSSGGALLGSRRFVSTYTYITGTITLSSALPFTPSIGDKFSLLPYTAYNVFNYLNNIKITQLSTIGVAETVDQGSKIQLSSLLNGSDGYVQVNGGAANSILGFSTALVNGVVAYSYYTGLLKIVNDTIYGSDLNPTAYPGVGAAGVFFDVASPTIKDIEFNLTVTLAAGYTLSQLSDQIYTAITSYVNSLPIGGAVILSEVISAVVLVQGVSDISISAPTANVQVNQDQLAKTNSSLITLG